MPKYYCDYCDAYLTHDSAAGRAQHIRGWKHVSAFKAYYANLYPQWNAEKQQELFSTTGQQMGQQFYPFMGQQIPLPPGMQSGMPPPPFTSMPPPPTQSMLGLPPPPGTMTAGLPPPPSSHPPSHHLQSGST